MDLDYSKDNKDGKCSANNCQQGKWKQMEDHDEEQHENHCQREETQEFNEWQLPNEYEDRNRDLFNLQRLAMEHQKSPFPDFQFDLMENEADPEDNGCNYNLATGTRKKPPTRMDSWEDNWLFQQRKCSLQTTTGGRNTLMSMKMYDTIDEQKNQEIDNYEKDESDASDCSSDCKLNEVERVERPCVRTSSSSSDSEASEDSESSESLSRNVQSSSNDADHQIPLLKSNSLSSKKSDSTDSSEQARQIDEQLTVKDMQSCGKNFTREKINNWSKESSIDNSPKRKEKQTEGKTLKMEESEEIDSDDSIENELAKAQESKPSCSHSDNSMLPKFLIERSNSPRPVSGTKSCTSEDSSSDEFQKKATANRSRRRASWCPLETSVASKKRGKRRPTILPLRVDEDEPELEIKPLATDEEALVGLERQMLQRDAHHSSFRAKKASPNFVLNPLYVPDEGAHNPRGHDPNNAPNAMQHLQPSKSESGYSSCSPDLMLHQNNMPLPQHDRKLHQVVRQDALNPTQHRMKSDHRVAPNDPDSSFLW